MNARQTMKTIMKNTNPPVTSANFVRMPMLSSLLRSSDATPTVPFKKVGELPVATAFLPVTGHEDRLDRGSIQILILRKLLRRAAFLSSFTDTLD